MTSSYRLIHPSILAAVLPALVLTGACGDDGAEGGTGPGSSTGPDLTTAADTTAPDPTTGPGTTSEPDTTTSSSTSTGDDPTTTTGEVMFRVSGKLSYEWVPFAGEGGGLDYAATVQRPIRGASVRLLDADTDEELASTWADEQGGYAFDYTGPAKVKLWVYAETQTPAVVIEDNTADDVVYVLESDVVDSDVDATLDVLARTGWTGDGYGEARAAAPFAVLDAVHGAATRFLTETVPPPDLAPLRVNWSVENRPEAGDLALGQIGTSHWDSTELYILGKADIDTDEFDAHVLVHEWCHYFQTHVARSDSPGGPHGEGDILDARLAWGEGACNGLSAVLLDPVFLYTDTSGPQQSVSYVMDLPDNVIDAEANPGWFGERTVAGILLDLYDGADEPFDGVEFGLQGVYDALLAQAEHPAQSTLFSFIAPLKDAHPDEADLIDDLVAYHAAGPDYGVDAIQDGWGAGESHAGDDPSNLPIYTDAVVDEMYLRDLVGGVPDNWAGQIRLFRITGDGLPITVTSTCDEDIDLVVYQAAELITEAATASGNEELTFDTIDGEIYVLTVRGFTEQPGLYTATVSLSH
jgi:hypothetical protein